MKTIYDDVTNQSDRDTLGGFVNPVCNDHFASKSISKLLYFTLLSTFWLSKRQELTLLFPWSARGGLTLGLWA